ncbi:MAG: tetratricopeptide repeat protein [Pseudomonadota bacterium]|nr:tetratricopeptide repeat protein [Pseudomonadota bacterium]
MVKSLSDFCNIVTVLDLNQAQHLFKYFFQQSSLEIDHVQARSLSGEQWSELLKVLPAHWILSYDDFNDLDPGDNNGTMHLTTALCAHGAHHASVHDSEADKVLQINSRLVKACVCYRENKLDEFLDHVNHLLNGTDIHDYPMCHARVLGRRALRYLNMKMHTESQQDLNMALSINPRDVFVLGVRGEMYRQQDKYEQALESFNEALGIDPNNQGALRGRGAVYREQGEYERALVDFNKVLDTNPDDMRALKVRGILYSQQGNYEQALVDLNRVLDIDLDDVLALKVRGILYRQQGNYEQALVDLNNVLDIDPDDTSSLKPRGEVYRLLGKYEQALVAFNKVLDIKPDDAVALKYRGDVYSRQGEYEQALVDLNKALSIKPDDVFALGARGDLYRMQGKYDQALVNLNKALRLNPRDGDALAKRGAVYKQQGKYEPALVDFNKVLAINPNDVFALGNRGDVYRQQGKYEQALVDLNKALSINPNYLFALRGRGEVYREQGEYDKALVDLNNVLDIDPDDPFALRGRGSVYRGQSEYEQALVDLNKALRIKPDNVFALVNRGAVYAMQGRTQAALDDVQRLLILSKDQETHSPILKKIEHILELKSRHPLNKHKPYQLQGSCQLQPTKSDQGAQEHTLSSDAQKQVVSSSQGSIVKPDMDGQPCESRVLFTGHNTYDDLVRTINHVCGHQKHTCNCTRICLALFQSWAQGSPVVASTQASNDHSLFAPKRTSLGKLKVTSLADHCDFVTDLKSCGFKLSPTVTIELDVTDQAPHEGESSSSGSSNGLAGTGANQGSTDVWMSPEVINQMHVCHAVNAENVHETIKNHYQLDQQRSDAFGFVATGCKVKGEEKRSLVKVEVDTYTIEHEKPGHMMAWYYAANDKKLYVIDGQAQGHKKVSANISPWLKASGFDQTVFFMRLDDKLVKTVGHNPKKTRFDEGVSEPSKRHCVR